jgi:hypothetical protein
MPAGHEAVSKFLDPALSKNVEDEAIWDPARRTWQLDR